MFRGRVRHVHFVGIGGVGMSGLAEILRTLEFDVSGKLLDSWGGPGEGYQWPQNPSGIAVDSKGNVWIAAAGAPAARRRTLRSRGRGAAPGGGW